MACDKLAAKRKEGREVGRVGGRKEGEGGRGEGEGGKEERGENSGL